MKTKFSETDGRFSLDSQWIVSSVVRPLRIYVQPFSGVGDVRIRRSGAQVRCARWQRAVLHRWMDGSWPCRFGWIRPAGASNGRSLFATRIGGAAATQMVLQTTCVVSADVSGSDDTRRVTSSARHRHPELEARRDGGAWTRLGHTRSCRCSAAAGWAVHRAKGLETPSRCRVEIFRHLHSRSWAGALPAKAQVLAALNHPHRRHGLDRLASSSSFLNSSTAKAWTNALRRFHSVDEALAIARQDRGGS
ncbi:MAG: hypothetical protein Udaeo2_22910 [Candidatus Udaeobacter sp.]|nr:MAG: hypothetical protein Udaeo2_22910 [Candidatus Udaeobacter sp.]